MATEIRLLIVGVGSIGERHLRCFARTNRVRSSICEINDELRQRVGQEYAVSDCYKNLEEALEDAPTAAVVSTPAHLHIPIAVRLAEAGVHLLIEKPLSTSMEELDQLRAICNERELIVAVGYVRRMDPVLVELREAVKAGQFGNILQVVAHSGQHFPHYRPAYRETYYRDRATGGGAIQDALTHLVNLGEWLVGPVTALAADADHQLLADVTVEDTVHVIARHQDILASYSLNQCQAPNESTLTLIGERGTAKYEAHHNRWQSMKGPEESWELHPGKSMGRDDHFVLQAEMFLDAIEHHHPIACSLDEGEQTLRVNLAILKAVAERRWENVGM